MKVKVHHVLVALLLPVWTHAQDQDCLREPVRIVSGQKEPALLIANVKYLYWIDMGHDRLLRVAKGGGAKELAELTSPRGLAVDRAAVYGSDRPCRRCPAAARLPGHRRLRPQRPGRHGGSDLPPLIKSRGKLPPI